MLLSLGLFVVTFALLMLLGRLAHRGLHAISLLLTGGGKLQAYLYALPLLPGVALHEVAHALSALMLGVEVRSFSLIPERKTDSITLGTVEVTRTDTFRTSLIGAAPLLAGLAVLSLIGWYVFDTSKLSAALVAGNLNAFVQQAGLAFRANDAFLWFYLMFAVANTMMPSEADRQSWPPVLLAMAVVFAIIGVLFGAQLLSVAAPAATRFMNWLSAVFAIIIVADLLVLAPLWLLVRGLERATGRTVVFGGRN